MLIIIYLFNSNVKIYFYICIMKAKNLLTPRKKSPYKMDPTSDRYRECPNDGVEFMAAHRTEKFCCPQCADEFHNEKKRLAKKLLQDEIKEALIQLGQNWLAGQITPDDITIVIIKKTK